MSRLIMSNSQYWRTTLVTYNEKKGVSILIKSSQRIFFGWYDETRAKLNTVHRLTVYSDNCLHLFEQTCWVKCFVTKYVLNFHNINIYIWDPFCSKHLKNLA